MLLMLLGLQQVARADEGETERLALLERGRLVLRTMDCARCHGRDYRGWAAPSLLAAVRDGSRQRFERSVLEGDPVRGMPGYRSQPLVADSIDAIYAYLVALATGTAAASPSSAASRSSLVSATRASTPSCSHLGLAI